MSEDKKTADAIKQRVYDLSKDSEHYARQQEKTKKAEDKGKTFNSRIENHKKNPKLYKQYVNEVRGIQNELEHGRDLSRTWIHVDFDMFYA